MVDTLYPAGANLLEGAAQSAGDVAKNETQNRQITAEQGSDAMKAVQANLDRMENNVQITPQIALGLVRNTGDKSWMEAVGQKMRADVLLGLYTHGINARQQDETFDVRNGDKTETWRKFFDPSSNSWKLEKLGEGETFSPTASGELTPAKEAEIASRERIAKDRTKSITAASWSQRERQNWLSNYEKRQRDVQSLQANVATSSDPTALQSQITKLIRGLQDDQAVYSELKSLQAQGGGAQQAAPDHDTKENKDTDLQSIYDAAQQ